MPSSQKIAILRTFSLLSAHWGGNPDGNLRYQWLFIVFNISTNTGH